MARVRWKYDGSWTQWYDTNGSNWPPPDMRNIAVSAVEVSEEITREQYEALLREWGKQPS